jgi:polyisoprenoid-binding protein YceI
MRLVILFLTVIISLPSFAVWQLNNQKSRLSFISVKKTNIAEVHHFKQLSGEFNGNGNVELIIDLSSVDTGIAIRNKRMQKFLFATNLFPQATFSATLHKNTLNSVAVGDSAIMSITGQLNLHGIQQKLTTKVLLAHLNKQQFIVSSIQPIIIQAANFKLAAGIEKLQALAKLPSISKAVPVSFVLTFEKH